MVNGHFGKWLHWSFFPCSCSISCGVWREWIGQGFFYGVGTPSGVGKMMDIASLGQINFKTEIQNAEQKRRYRDAVRWHYLQLLHHLEEQELILWKPEKTNADYASELKGKPFLPAFREATRHFEYVWYGEYSPDEMAYRHIVASFEALSHLNHKLT